MPMQRGKNYAQQRAKIERNSSYNVKTVAVLRALFALKIKVVRHKPGFRICAATEPM